MQDNSTDNREKIYFDEVNKIRIQWKEAWRPVRNILPGTDMESISYIVFICHEDGTNHITRANFDGENFYYIKNGNRHYYSDVTHWIPMPRHLDAGCKHPLNLSVPPEVLLGTMRDAINKYTALVRRHEQTIDRLLTENANLSSLLSKFNPSSSTLQDNEND